MSRFSDEYKRKLLSMEDAAKLIESGDKIVQSQSICEAVGLMNAIGKRGIAAEFDDVEFIGMGTTISNDWIKPEVYPHLRLNTCFLLTPPSREAVNNGYADFWCGHFNMLEDEINNYIVKNLPPGKLKVISAATPMDKYGYFCVPSVHYFPTASRMDNAVVILEINEKMPRVNGDTFIHISQVAHVVENHRPLFTLPQAKETAPEDVAIANHLIDLIEDGSTIQLGIGGMPNALGKLLESKRDLGAHTEMMMDAFKYLWEIGVLNGKKKTLSKEKISANFVLGSSELYEWMNENPALEMRQLSFTNDPYVIGQHYKMISINQCLAVDLTGQVASETIGTRMYSGTGGQRDFNRGAQMSPGGKSFLCLRSTANTKSGIVSKIVPTFKEAGTVVTTPRSEVQYIATEYGVALLKGKSIRERVRALINIAHPDFRDELYEGAKRVKYI